VYLYFIIWSTVLLCHSVEICVLHTTERMSSDGTVFGYYCNCIHFNMLMRCTVTWPKTWDFKPLSPRWDRDVQPSRPWWDQGVSKNVLRRSRLRPKLHRWHLTGCLSVEVPVRGSRVLSSGKQESTTVCIKAFWHAYIWIWKHFYTFVNQ